MRRRCGGPGGWPGGGPGGDGPGGGGRLGDPAVEVRRRLVFRPTSSSSMEGLKESLGMKITAQGLSTPPPPTLIFPEKRPHGAGGQTSTSLKTPSSLMTDWFLILRTSCRSRGQT
ncbi:unnamed protein product [Arctogadus glacialis]